MCSKGRKERSIPLWPKTALILKEWFHEINAGDDAMAFPNVRRAPLTRFAIHLLLRKAVHVASTRCPTLNDKRISPHVIRHGTAMALLQAGVDLAVIAVWLGHESIETSSDDSVQTTVCWPSWNRSDCVDFGAQNNAPHI